MDDTRLAVIVTEYISIIGSLGNKKNPPVAKPPEG